MAYNDNWLPGRREAQLAMAKTWLAVMSNMGGTWNIPVSENTDLNDLITAAEIIFIQAQSSERTPVITAMCAAAFDALIDKMRIIKRRYFLSPPLSDADIVSLELKPRAPHSPVSPPEGQAEADILRPGVHLLELHLRPVQGTPASAARSDYGYRVYYGVMPQGGATLEAAAGIKRELVKVPISGEELPHSKFTRRRKERFDFAQEDSAKTVYFCVRYENSKGDPGAWGPMFSAVIP